MPKLTNLTDMDIREVSFVDAGANEHARVVLIFKSANGELVAKASQGIQFVIGFRSDGGSAVQSVIFDSDVWEEKDARAWLKDHDMRSDKADKTENTIRFRQRDPSEFERFRIIVPGKQITKALNSATGWENIRAALDAAVQEKFCQKDTDGSTKRWAYLRDFWQDDLIMETGPDRKVFRVSYTVNRNEKGDIQVSLGNAVPVRMFYVDDIPNTPPVASTEIVNRVVALQADQLEHRMREMAG